MSEPINVADKIDGVMSVLERMNRRMDAMKERIRPFFYAAPDATVCPEHPKIVLSKNWQLTVEASWREGKATIVNDKCEACELDRNFQKLNDKWLKRGIPENLCHATFDNFKEGDDEHKSKRQKALNKVQKFAKAKKGFCILVGSTGVGKGHLAVSVIKEKDKGLFITHADLISAIRETYGGKGSEREVIERYQKTSILVLDELGVRTGGKDEESILYRILSERYNRNLKTVITSNEELATVKEILGYRLMDRIAETSDPVVPMDWPSHRRKYVGTIIH